MESITLVCISLFIATIWSGYWLIHLLIRERKARHPYVQRLKVHNIQVQYLINQCGYCKGSLIELHQQVSTPPKVGAKDLGIKHRKRIAIFCSKCGARDFNELEGESKIANNIETFIKDLEAISREKTRQDENKS